MIGIVKSFLQINNYKQENDDFENLFLSHPNYPSLYAVTDTLDLLGVENVAAQVPKEQFLELPSSYLALVNDEVVLVIKKENTIIIEKESETKKLSIDAFLTQWNGIVVAIEANDVVVKKKLGFLNNKSFFLIVVLAVLFLVQFPIFNGISMVNYGLLAAGFFLSIAIIDEKLHKTEGVVSKICSFSEKTSCDSVIKSDSAKLTKWLDFSDLPIVFFGTGLLTLLIHPLSFPILNFLSMLSLPIIGYSIWLQKIKLEKWCVLCLGVSTIIVLQSIIFLLYPANLNFNYAPFLLSILLVSCLWFFIKPYLFGKVALEKENLALLKFKRNFSIFASLQKTVNQPEQLDCFHKITLGNPEALLEVVLILSPSCGHCHTAFKEGMDLINRYSNKVKLVVFFNLNPDNGQNPYLSIAENLLQINKDYPDKIEEAISDWHILRMDLGQWKSKWEQQDITLDIEENLRKQYEWCLSNDFNYTPVKLVNRKLFPKEYELAELKYFISELEEEKEPLLV